MLQNQLGTFGKREEEFEALKQQLRDLEAAKLELVRVHNNMLRDANLRADGEGQRADRLTAELTSCKAILEGERVARAGPSTSATSSEDSSEVKALKRHIMFLEQNNTVLQLLLAGEKTGAMGYLKSSKGMD